MVSGYTEKFVISYQILTPPSCLLPEGRKSILDWIRGTFLISFSPSRHDFHYAPALSSPRTVLSISFSLNGFRIMASTQLVFVFPQCISSHAPDTTMTGDFGARSLRSRDNSQPFIKRHLAVGDDKVVRTSEKEFSCLFPPHGGMVCGPFSITISLCNIFSRFLFWP